MPRFLLLAGVLCALGGCNKLCQCFHKPPVHKSEARAGYPDEVSCCAYPSDTGRYVGYTVGGGAVPCGCVDGEGPDCDDGTWGWDYPGYHFQSKIMLNWWHGRKAQGYGGAYKIDGPRPRKALEVHKENKLEERQGHGHEGGHANGHEGGHEGGQ